MSYKLKLLIYCSERVYHDYSAINIVNEIFTIYFGKCPIKNMEVVNFERNINVLIKCDAIVEFLEKKQQVINRMKLTGMKDVHSKLEHAIRKHEEHESISIIYI